MPKLKTHSATKKRLVISKKGKLLRRHASGNHFLQKKKAARKRQFSGLEVLTGKQVKSVKRRLGA